MPLPELSPTTGPIGWVAAAFQYAIGREDRNRIESAQIRAAREAGYSGTRAQLVAIGQGLRSGAAFQLGQGGGPGPDRAGPGRPAIASTPPLIPFPGLPPLPGSSPPAPIPGGVPGRPGGVSIPDRIPPRVGAGAAGVAGVLSRVIGWGAGLLFYPSSTSSTDVVCIDTQYGPWCPPGMPAVPAPAIPRPGARPGRRPRAVPQSPPRRRERGRTAAPPAAIPQPRGRPVTISRPAVIPQARVIDRTFPAPQSLPPPVFNPSQVTVPAPRAIPAPVPRVSPVAAVATLAIPGLLSWLGTQTGSQTNLVPGVGAIPGAGVNAIPGVGVVQLPGGAVNPLAELATQPLPLTQPYRAVAQSPAQELDRQCRERAKQKRKKRKPKERTECYRGTFYELRKGTRKQRKEKIPCR